MKDSNWSKPSVLFVHIMSIALDSTEVEIFKMNIYVGEPSVGLFDSKAGLLN